MKPAYLVAAVVGMLLCRPYQALSCSRVSPVSTDDMLREADLIVRAIAVEYTRPPADPHLWTTGEPDSRVRFKIIETVRGRDVPAEILLPGYLSDKDDFNDHDTPYRFVRPNGKAGSCFANTYKTGAQFLLFLKAGNGTYTVNWYALGPVNEQLHSETDPWLLWVRERARKASAA